MSVQAMDLVYSRWLLNSEFRKLMDEDPNAALTGYDLTVDASPMSRPILERFGFQMIAVSFPCKWNPASQTQGAAR